jgi:hypothetical protein
LHLVNQRHGCTNAGSGIAGEIQRILGIRRTGTSAVLAEKADAEDPIEVSSSGVSVHLIIAGIR